MRAPGRCDPYYLDPHPTRLLNRHRSRTPPLKMVAVTGLVAGHSDYLS
jgi:hypothetical protein